MKYMLMVLGNQAEYDAMVGKGDSPVEWTEEIMRAMYAHMGAINNDLAESGEFVDAQGLSAPAEGKAVTLDASGQPVVSDGPFTEAKEVLAGYWIVDVADENRAVEIAARVLRCPTPEGADSLPVVVQPLQGGGAEA